MTPNADMGALGATGWRRVLSANPNKVWGREAAVNTDTLPGQANSLVGPYISKPTLADTTGASA